MFLAGGVAFNILLAGVPFILLLSSGLGYLLGTSLDSSTTLVQGVLSGLMPQRSVPGSMLDPILQDVVRTRAAVGIGGAIGFLYFSARLFGALRSVMSSVFNHGRDRTVLRGLLWDVHLSVMTVALIIAWVVVSAFLTVSSGRIGAALVARGVGVEVLSGVELLIGRLVAVAVVVAIFVSLYRWLPKRKTEWGAALGGAVTAGLLFEIARWLFGIVASAFPPASIYTGTLGALVVIVFWTYYAALIFVLGAEVASAIHETQTSPEPT
jgi:membrane protein